MADSQYSSTPEDTASLPRGIKYIIGNEAAERFSYYGMRTILVVFMTKYLHWMVAGVEGTEMSNAQSNEHFHLFVAATYFFPVMGSLLADVFLGKYRTILYLSIVYCLGHFALALMGGPGLSPGWWLATGLFLISFGSGGIKPCVSAHVGDQFGAKNSHLMTKVFQWFYFAINFGSMASTFLTPVLLLWYGPHIAFGVPGVLMAIATLLFWMGRNTFIHVPPAGKNFFKETFSPEGITALLKLSLIYAFVAVFWGLFDQTGSSWVLQAKNMNRRFLGMDWLESQIQVINPILVLILIPLFQFVVYPAVGKVFKLTSIRKISIGFFLTAASFYTVTIAQQLIDQGQTPSIAWQLWAYVLLTAGEVMISITGLEFSYTQAPKSMKSVIMAVWLFSVSLGNVFTGYFNHSIQVAGVNDVAGVAESLQVGEGTTGLWAYKTASKAIEGSEKTGKTVRISGFDGQYDTPDDVVLEFDDYNKLESVTSSENDVLETAAKLIDEAFFASDGDKALPSEEEGNQLISALSDSQGKPLVYKLLSKNDYRLSSTGADGKPQTQWDAILKGSVSRADLSLQGKVDAPYNWLETRIIETLGDEGKARVEKARGDIPETKIDQSITVGGQDTKEGAEYFMFWTQVILYTALLFVPVGYLYKEKSYIQTEQETPPEA